MMGDAVQHTAVQLTSSASNMHNLEKTCIALRIVCAPCARPPEFLPGESIGFDPLREADSGRPRTLSQQFC